MYPPFVLNFEKVFCLCIQHIHKTPKIYDWLLKRSYICFSRPGTGRKCDRQNKKAGYRKWIPRPGCSKFRRSFLVLKSKTFFIAYSNPERIAVFTIASQAFRLVASFQPGLNFRACLDCICRLESCIWFDWHIIALGAIATDYLKCASYSFAQMTDRRLHKLECTHESVYLRKVTLKIWGSSDLATLHLFLKNI